MRIALGVEYAGTHFCGWQLQQGVRTVQACVEEALGRVADHPVRVACAGRTDTAVHALGQVVHFDTAAERRPRSWVFGANTYLPPDVSVRWAQPVAEAIKERIGKAAYDIALKNGGIELVPFEVMRGRSWKNAFVLLDEAQNCTAAEIKTFLTRIGEDCTMVINGDSEPAGIMAFCFEQLGYIHASHI